MQNKLSRVLFISFFILTANFCQAQILKFDALISTFSSDGFPEIFYDTLEARGLYRIDKIYPENCVRAMYVQEKKGKSAFFASTHLCMYAMRNAFYPLKAKQQIELQFQRLAKPEFYTLSNVIRKQCTLLPEKQATIAAKPVSAKKNKASKPQAYFHPASGITFIICDMSPAAYIYLLKNK